MKMAWGVLKRLIKEASDLTNTRSGYVAAVYDEEIDGVRSFFHGSLEECTSAAQRMARLLKTKVIELEEFDAGGVEDADVLVVPEGNSIVGGSAIGVVLQAKDNTYGPSLIKAGYGDIDDAEQDQTWFQPTKHSNFQPHDEIIFARFSPSSPGGWYVTNVEVTRVEYWQEGTIEDTEIE